MSFPAIGVSSVKMMDAGCLSFMQLIVDAVREQLDGDEEEALAVDDEAGEASDEE